MLQYLSKIPTRLNCTITVYNVLPVYLCIRYRDVVCGIVEKEAVNCLLQIRPVVFTIVF